MNTGRRLMWKTSPGHPPDLLLERFSGSMTMSRCFSLGCFERRIIICWTATSENVNKLLNKQPVLLFIWWEKLHKPWASVLTVHYYTHVEDLLVIIIWEVRQWLCTSNFWSLDDVKWRQIFLGSHISLFTCPPIISLLYLHCNLSCFVMSVVAWRHLPASRSPQQSDWHHCVDLTKERPATKERPWGSVSLALYSRSRWMMEWQYFSFSLQLYLSCTLPPPAYLYSAPNCQISRGEKWEK